MQQDDELRMELTYQNFVITNTLYRILIVDNIHCENRSKLKSAKKLYCIAINCK